MPSGSSAKLARNGLFVGVGLILLIQVGVSRMLSIDETKIPVPHLQRIPTDLSTWKAGQEQALDEWTMKQLNPDDYLLRDYQNTQNQASVNLFVAFFKSLQHTYGPHAPRICLPGAGWLERSAKLTTITVPGRPDGIPVNQLTYEKSDSRILVLYWYQNDRAIWAEEFQAKFRLLPDLIKYRRSDVSLVRLITPLRSATQEEELKNSVDFARAVFPSLVARFETVQ